MKKISAKHFKRFIQLSRFWACTLIVYLQAWLDWARLVKRSCTTTALVTAGLGVLVAGPVVKYDGVCPGVCKIITFIYHTSMNSITSWHCMGLQYVNMVTYTHSAIFRDNIPTKNRWNPNYSTLWPVFIWYTGMCSLIGDLSGQWSSISMTSQWPVIMTSQWVMMLLGLPIVK